MTEINANGRKAMNPCFGCGYCWREPDEEYERCHYDGPEAWAPCEQDDYRYEDENLMGGDY